MSSAKAIRPEGLRPITIERGVNKYAEGSVCITVGETRVLCTASVEDRVPDWMRGKGRGWVTAEYSMLPRSTSTRNRRERDRASSRSLEISRLIGRSLRAAVDLSVLGERQIVIDCDVLQADGGTRCASITGGMLALADSLSWAAGKFGLAKNPRKCLVAAISAGIVRGKPKVDLAYEDDQSADVDMNFVFTDDGRIVEIQGSAEREPFTDRQLSAMKKMAMNGVSYLTSLQSQVLGGKSLVKG